MLHRRVRAGGLWFGILCGPLAALTNEQIEYVMVSWSCGRFDATSRYLLHAVPIALILLCVVSGLVAWSARTHPVDASDEHATNADRSRRGFMALLGVGLSVLGILVLLAQWMPVWYLSPCSFL
ncbi:MAG TPA: hypothetical protein VIG47_04535 [Gemmatimonadaceae bacterium]